MGVYTVGASGYMFTALADAVTAAGADPIAEFKLYGPHTEDNQTFLWALTGSTITVYNDIYTFDGLGALGQWMDVPGAGAANLTITGNGFLEVTNYTTGPVLDIVADNCSFSGITFTRNGTAATGIYQIFSAGVTGLRLADITIDTNIVPSAGIACVGIFLESVTDSVLDHIIVEGLETAAGGDRVWGIYLNSNCENIQIYRSIVRNCTSVAWCGGIRCQGRASTAGQMSRVEQCVVYNMVGTVAYGFRLERGSYQVFNSLCYNFTAPTGRGVLSFSTTPDPTHPSTLIYNNTFYNTVLGIYMFNTAGNTPIIAYNNIAHSCTGSGFTCSAAAMPYTSDYNTAYNNGTDYGPNWVAAANDVITDPDLVNPAGGDFRLASTSPDIGTGRTLSAVTYDLAGVTRPQAVGYDRGAYEFLGVRNCVVYGSHFYTTTATLIAANFVDSTAPATKVAAVTVTLLEDALTQFAIASDVTGVVAAGSAIFTDAAANFNPSDEGKYLYLFNCAQENWGHALITQFISPTQVLTEKTFVFDGASGAIEWSTIPSWSAPVVARYANYAETGGKIVLVEVPAIGVLGAGVYWIEIILPNGESTIFTHQTLTVP